MNWRDLWLAASVLTGLVLGALTGDYIGGLLTQAFTFAMLAVSADILWGLTGILTFGSSAMFGIGAYAVGIFFVHGAYGAWTVPLALGAALAATVFVSLIVGGLVFHTRTRISEFYVTLVTLGLSVLFAQLTVYGGRLTGGSNGLSGFQTGLLSARGWYWTCAAALAVTLASAHQLSRSDFGLVLRALKDHGTRCRYLGIDTAWVRTLTFAGCNAVACLAGCLYALYTTVVAPSLVDFLLATNVLIWVTLGGKGTLFGPVLVAIAIVVGSPSLNAAYPLYWQGILGLIFIIAVVALPQGLLPAVVAWLGSWFRVVARFSRRPTRVGPDSADGLQLRVRRAPAARAHASDGRSILEVAGVSKHYGTFAAVRDVSFTVRRGELISIVGPNGAGKTSLLRCLSDGIERTDGTVHLFGLSIGRLAPDKIVGLGLGRKFQGASIFPGLTVGACILLASWRGALPSLWRRSTAVEVSPQAASVIAHMRLQEVWNERAGDISHGQRQALELAMVLALAPRLLLLDEPTSGLTHGERREVGMLLRDLASSHELGILLIEHDFEFVKEVSTRMIVLHEGAVLIDGTVAEVAASRLVRDVYLGRQLEVAE